jgi:hypothetical protein
VRPSDPTLPNQDGRPAHNQRVGWSKRGAPHATPLEAIGAPARSHVGRRETGCGQKARRAETEPVARRPRATRGALPGSRHPSHARRDSIPSIRADLPGDMPRDLRLDAPVVSRHPLLDSARSRSPDRRRRRLPRAHDWHSRTGGSRREGGQPRRRAERPRVERALPRSHAAFSHRGATRNRLCPAELQEASARDDRRRSTELRTMVRRVAKSAASARTRATRRGA